MDGFIGEIRIFPWNWNPESWLLCNGATVSAQQYQALYAVIGNAFGGNGNPNFNLPNFQGQAPMGMGTGSGLTPRTIGAAVGGTGSVTLVPGQMPAHTHNLTAQVGSPAASDTQAPAANISVLTRLYSGAEVGTSLKVCKAFLPSTTPNTSLAPATVGSAGSGGAHENRQPFLAMSFCICWQGEFPIRS